MARKCIKRLKYIFAALLLLIVVFVLSFSIWFSSGYLKEEDYHNPYFKAGDSVFIDEAIDDKFSIGFSKEIITPDDITREKYYMGGYFTFPATYATQVLDDLYVRALCIDDNSGRGSVALAVIDSIGLSNKDVNIIRERLNDFASSNHLKSINVMTTHLHSGIDTQGLWGPLPKTGKNKGFMDNLFDKTAKAIMDAHNSMTRGDLYYAETLAEDKFLDHRDPQVIDESIVRLRFSPDNSQNKEIYIINLASHPEALMHGNSIVTADFPAYMGKVIESHEAEFIFFNGAIGGLINSAQIEDYYQGMSDVDEMIEYGTILGNLIMSIDNNTEIKLDPIINIASRKVNLPLLNGILRFAGKAGVINNQAVKVTGKDHKYEIITEIGYLELGTYLKIMLIPGEIFPELAFGGVLNESDSYTKTSFEYTLLKDMVDQNSRLIVFGLTNDEIGYIIPDNDFAITKFMPYLRTVEGHYEETVSAGPNTASILLTSMYDLIDSVR